MVIKSKDIRKIFNSLLLHAEDMLKDEMDLSFSTFWVIRFEEGIKLDPADPTVADLRDDITNVLKLLDDKHPLTILDYERLGNIIKAIGKQIFKKQ